MDLQWRKFPLVLAFAAVVATPALGDGSESAKSIPDFSGVWLHTLPGFEPLPTGPTALINTQRRENGTGNILKLAGDYTNPILTPQAAEIVKMHAERGLNHIGDPNPRNQCRPEGVPFLFTDRPTELLQQKNKVTILYGHDHQIQLLPAFRGIVELKAARINGEHRPKQRWAAAGLRILHG